MWNFNGFFYYEKNIYILTNFVFTLSRGSNLKKNTFFTLET
jgi:hypothetical protein